MSGTLTEGLEIAPKIVSVLGGFVGMIGGIMGIMASRSVRKRDRAARQEYDEMWNAYVTIIGAINAGGGNTLIPQPGSKEHKLAEKMVDKGWLHRGQFGGYMLRSTMNSGGSGDRESDGGMC
jgi:hypothetical protein